MEITPLELGLAAAVVVVAFGPKKLPKKREVEAPEQVDLSSTIPSQYAAGRAPSPLSVRGASPVHKSDRDYALVEQPYQYEQPSKLPYEF